MIHLFSRLKVVATTPGDMHHRKDRRVVDKIPTMCILLDATPPQSAQSCIFTKFCLLIFNQQLQNFIIIFIYKVELKIWTFIIRQNHIKTHHFVPVTGRHCCIRTRSRLVKIQLESWYDTQKIATFDMQIDLDDIYQN